MLTPDSQVDTDPYASVECLNMSEVRMVSPHFLPLDSKKGGNITYITICLTEDQTEYVYKKVEQGSDLNTETMKQEIEQEKMTGMRTNGKNENIYQR